MILTADNYYSQEANREYLSVSQYKDFCGSLGKIPCEAQAMAKLNGEWETEKTTALLVGSYVDSYFEGSLEQFKQENPEIFTKKGELRSEFKKAEELIARIERDEMSMKYLSGEKQTIMTGEIGGAKWKIKMDSYLPGRAIVDLKVMASLTKSFWVRDSGYMSFVVYWGYDIQGAVYQEIVRQNTGLVLPFYIVAISKEEYPDLRPPIFIDDCVLSDRLEEVKHNTANIIRLKAGEVEPFRCDMCNYCRHTRINTKPIHFSELITEV